MKVKFHFSVNMASLIIDVAQQPLNIFQFGLRHLIAYKVSPPNLRPGISLIFPRSRFGFSFVHDS